MYNIVYKKKIIASSLTDEECSDFLFELAEKSYDGEIDPNEVEIEKVNK